MTMTRILFSMLLFLFSTGSHSQQLSHIHFTKGETVAALFFSTDQQIIIKVSLDGKVLEWGTEWEQTRFNYQPGKLLPYMGRVSYYGNEADSVSKGKVKGIGTATLTYYPGSEIAAKAGKLKSIGNISLDYYSAYDNAALTGKIKSAGNTVFSYYASHENEAFRGKLKSAGTSNIIYYSSFDDKQIKGRVKNIDGVNYNWYTSYESRFGAGLKSGAINWLINGVTYIVW
jgi:hypothetical protein